MPHKIGKIIKCYCPSCEKMEFIYPIQGFEKSIFKNSKLIDLAILENTNDNLPIILENIFNNYGFYYNEEISENELKESILNSLNCKVKKIIPNKNQF